MLEIIKDEELQANALKIGNHLLAGLREIQKHCSLIGDVRGTGLYIGAEFVLDQQSKAPATAEVDKVVESMRNKNILVSTEGPDHNVLKIKPPMVINKEQADFFLENLQNSIKELGFWQ